MAGITYNGPLSGKKPGATPAADQDMPEYAAWVGKPGPETMGRLLDKLRPTIEKATVTVAGDKAPSLMPKAMLMASDYVKSYDPKAGMALPSYITQGLRGLHRVKTERSNVIHIPEEAGLLGNKLRLAEKELQDDLGREPTVVELADKTGISVKRIGDIRRRRPVVAGSQATGLEGDDLFGRLGGMERTWADMVYHELDPHGQKIYEWTTGYGGAETLPKMEIARRLRISPAAVSQRINTISRKLEDCPSAYTGA